jgi:hypothetical protein
MESRTVAAKSKVYRDYKVGDHVVVVRKNHHMVGLTGEVQDIPSDRNAVYVKFGHTVGMFLAFSSVRPIKPPVSFDDIPF